MAGREAAITRAARDHGLSEGAAAALWEALVRGGGRMAQFSHPDLGGMGQWSSGMLQIGDMFNHDLKMRVAAACADLAAAAMAPTVADDGGQGASWPSQLQGGSSRSPEPRTSVPRTGNLASAAGMGFAGDWWPGDFGRPAAAGAQNGLRYAYFAEHRRLAIERAGRVTLYDTAHHRISGVSQQQSRGTDLAFTAQDGTVDLDHLKIVSL